MNRVPRVSIWRLAAVAVAAGLVLAALGAGGASAKSTGKGTVTFAEQPSSPPNYIFPLESGSYFDYENICQFMPNMYLPLYWFGQSGQAVFNESLSLAKAPVFSANNTIATINLKHWSWSNGQPITSRDVIFWMNLLTAVTDPQAPAVGSTNSPGPGWGGAVPGGFPENVISYKATGTYSVVFHLNASYNPTWFLYNELSQVYPIPQKSWDKLSKSGAVGNYDTAAEPRTTLAGTSPAQYVPTDPGTASSGALGVAQFLNKQSQDLATYDSNPLWKVVDGAFKLSQFTSDGFVKLVPNQAYSGSPKPTVKAFEELPYTTDTAEFDALRSGSLTIGYIPTQDLAQKSTLEKSKGYTYNPWNISGINYFAYNFSNQATGPVFDQLYFRQAFQSLVNQKQYIKDFLGGIGNVNNGPVPTYPSNSQFLSPLVKHGEVYPYAPSKAVALLKANGWTVVPGGTSYCSKPGSGAGECGVGIKLHEDASFPLMYASGVTALTNIVQALQSTLKQQAGIDLTLTEATLDQVDSVSYNGCSPTTPCNNWSIVATSISAAWTYLPDYLPTGEENFFSGSGSNIADYSNPTNDANITATTTAPTKAAEITALHTYENFLARQLPRIWMPSTPVQLTMYKSALKGLVPQGIFEELTPQYYTLKG